MTTDIITAEAGTDLRQAYDIMIEHKMETSINKKGKLVGLYSFSDVRTY